MKVPLSIKNIYDSKIILYESLKKYVDSWIIDSKYGKWHYESRVKELESFALKFETGRFTTASIFDDAFAGMIVVPTIKDIENVEGMLREKFSLVSKKPNDPAYATYSPEHFVFDDLRLYLKFEKENYLSPKADELDGLVFEVQIKTFLQHAWALSTHDLVYKSENISWSKHRVAYQVKAMLENIELSISSVDELSCNSIINKQDKRFKSLTKLVTLLNDKWEVESLPKDKKRLVENIFECMRKLDLNVNTLRSVIDKTQCNNMKSISPYQSVLLGLINEKFGSFIKENPNKLKVLLTSEVKEMLPQEKIDFLIENEYLVIL